MVIHLPLFPRTFDFLDSNQNSLFFFLALFVGMLYTKSTSDIEISPLPLPGQPAIKSGTISVEYIPDI